MTVNKRDILAPSAIQNPSHDSGSEGVKSVEPSTRSALGDTSAHGDESLAAWKRDAKRPDSVRASRVVALAASSSAASKSKAKGTRQ